MNKYKILSIIGIILALIVVAFSIFLYFAINRTVFDRGFILSDKTETIEVFYVNWACDGANFCETKLFKNKNYTLNEDDCIFIEPSNVKNKIPDEYFSTLHFEYRLKLKGQFYLDKGIPESYGTDIEIRPSHARVFRYDSFELVKK